MRNLFKVRDRDKLLIRLGQLKPDAERRWGKMSAHQMLVHLADPIRTALGERPVPYRPSIFGKFPINKFVSQIMPWPKSAPTASEFTPGVGGSDLTEFEKDKQKLIELIKRFSVEEQGEQFPLHPSFNKLTNKEWARVMWRHINHHLCQFGH